VSGGRLGAPVSLAAAVGACSASLSVGVLQPARQSHQRFQESPVFLLELSVTFLEGALVLLEPDLAPLHAVAPRVAVGVVGVGGHHYVGGPYKPIVSFLKPLRKLAQALELIENPHNFFMTFQHLGAFPFMTF
jgi:hypothetical protein